MNYFICFRYQQSLICVAAGDKPRNQIFCSARLQLRECGNFDIDFRFGFEDIVKNCFKQTCHLSGIFLISGIADLQG